MNNDHHKDDDNMAIEHISVTICDLVEGFIPSPKPPLQGPPVPMQASTIRLLELKEKMVDGKGR